MTPRRESLRRLAHWLRRDGLLTEGWTVDEAADFILTLLSLHTYESLVVERGWSVARLVEHLRTTLHRALLDRPPD